MKKTMFLSLVTIFSLNLFAQNVNVGELELKAKKGDAKSQYQLGLYYSTKKNDLTNAMLWYKKSAKQGNSDAFLALTLLKEAISKNKSMVSKSNIVRLKSKSFNIVNLRNAKDHTTFLKDKAITGDAKSQYELGLIYNNGYGVAQNSKEALKWFKLSSEQGYQEAVLAYKILKEANTKN